MRVSVGRFAMDAMRLQADLLWGGATMVMGSFQRILEPASGIGNDRPVILVPGFMGPELSLSELHARLARRGYRPDHWGMGTNTGHRSPEAAERIFAWIADRAKRLSDSTGKRVAIVGQSLGGIYAREAAKVSGGCVDRVVTLGTPAYVTAETADRVNGVVSALFRRATMQDVRQQLSDPSYAALIEEPPCHLVSVWSPVDAVADPDAARIPEGRIAASLPLLRRNVEVYSSHCGMGSHRGAIGAVYDALEFI